MFIIQYNIYIDIYIYIIIYMHIHLYNVYHIWKDVDMSMAFTPRSSMTHRWWRVSSKPCARSTRSCEPRRLPCNSAAELLSVAVSPLRIPFKWLKSFENAMKMADIKENPIKMPEIPRKIVINDGNSGANHRDLTRENHDIMGIQCWYNPIRIPIFRSH